MSYACINGWTKADMLKVIEARPSTKPASDGEFCAYLAPDGSKCAVGLFLPDGHPGQQHRGALRSLLENYPELQDALPLASDYMRILQNSHDRGPSDANVKKLMLNWVKNEVEDDV